MRKILMICLAFVFMGCSYGNQKIQGYMENPKTILEDPLSVNYEKAKDDLERSYLNKEITYDQYLKQKQQLEDDYTKQVQDRTDIIEDVK